MKSHHLLGTFLVVPLGSKSVVLFICDVSGIFGLIIQGLRVLRFCASITGQPSLGLWGH